jgi:hypothetical protein
MGSNGATVKNNPLKTRGFLNIFATGDDQKRQKIEDL